jgi:hypothetical protein
MVRTFVSKQNVRSIIPQETVAIGTAVKFVSIGAAKELVDPCLTTKDIRSGIAIEEVGIGTTRQHVVIVAT